MWEPCRKKDKLDAYLEEVFKQFISIKDYDLKQAQEIFHNVFNQIKRKMKEQSNYYDRYCKEVLYAGSVYDGTKIAHMDEFDMDIVIKLPINYNEILLENDQPGFLRLKITDAFDNLDKQPDWEKYHKVVREWRDSDKYLLQNKIRQWLQGVVAKAINELNGQVDVNGTVYLVKYKESGPAYTLQIRNKGDEDFRLDVDLVPVIRFQHPRWPEGYKTKQYKKLRNWFLIPKPNKTIPYMALKNRSWRLSFQIYEKEMMRGSHGLKTTIKLVKKLRDSLQLKSIASYYIKTLFLWEIDHAEDKNYWCNKTSVIFRDMVEKLYFAVKERKLKYFWHPENNLLQNVSPTWLSEDERKLQKVHGALYGNDYETVIDYLLTPDELIKFKSLKFYREFSSFKTTNLWNQCSLQVFLQPPQPFQFETNFGDMSSSWEKWKRSFEIFYEACELSKKERKVQRNILLHVIGDQCRDMYDQFSEKFETVEEILLKFDEVILPKKDIILQRHNFFTREQKETESIQQYVLELKKLMTKCAFKDFYDDLLRDRLICGIRDVALRQKLLGEIDLTSSKTISMCRLAEASQAQVEKNTGNKSVNNSESNNTSADEKSNRGHDSLSDNTNHTPIQRASSPSITHVRDPNFVTECSWCGTSHRKGQCPSFGEQCSKCKRMNHFAAVCRTYGFQEELVNQDQRKTSVNISNDKRPNKYERQVESESGSELDSELESESGSESETESE